MKSGIFVEGRTEGSRRCFSLASEETFLRKIRKIFEAIYVSFNAFLLSSAD